MQLDLRFVRRVHEGEDVWSYVFEPPAPLGHRPGQTVRLTLPHPDPDARGASRTFTISSAPSEPFVMVTTRLGDPPSSFKRALHALEPGALVAARGPHGGFVYEGHEGPAVFLVGGIGVTPARSVLVELAERDAPADVALVHANRTPEIPFRGLFDALARRWPGLRTTHTVTRPTPSWRGPVGRIGAELLRERVPDLADRLCFVCGPEAMVESTVGLVLDLGVRPERIREESFPGYEAAPPARATA